MTLRDHWSGHLLRFDRRSAPAYARAAGLRLLLIVVLLEGLLGPRLWLLDALGLPEPPGHLRVPALLVSTLMLVRWFAGLRLRQIGFRPWREWSLAERSYFLQIVFLAAIVIVAIRPRLLHVALGTLATSLLWGFHQEVVYRGILQTELVRRIGAVGGVVVANIIFTLGPLHFYHVSSAALPMLASIFAIGLLFGAVFQRSGNLWIVAVFHGLGAVFALSAPPG